MYFCAVLIIFLITLHEIKCQRYIHSDTLNKDYNLKLKDYGIKVSSKITEDDLLDVIKSLGPHACRMKDPSKYCRSFRTCYECVSSMKYPCNWCHNFGCSHKQDKLCTVYTMGDFELRNLSCPFIYTKTPILIPSGIGNHVAVKINIPDSALMERDLICQINLKYHMIHAKGIVAKNTVYCFPPRLVIHSAREVGGLRLLWDGVEPYSNEIPVYLYRCDKMASSCMDCRNLPLKYGCGWCENTGQCVGAANCKYGQGWSFNEACLPNS